MRYLIEGNNNNEITQIARKTLFYYILTLIWNMSIGIHYDIKYF